MQTSRQIDTAPGPLGSALLALFVLGVFIAVCAGWLAPEGCSARLALLNPSLCEAR